VTAPEAPAPAPAAPRGGPSPLLPAFYDLAYLVALLVCLPVVLFQMVVNPRYRAGLWQRLGFIPRRSGSRPCLWVHGVSVGEVKAAQGLIQEFQGAHPDYDVVVSTTTKQGWEVARALHPERFLFFYPLDFSFVTRRILARVRPDIVALMELEIWPNFLSSTSRRGVPVVILNGRVSRKSFRGYRILQNLMGEPLNRILFYSVQTRRYGERLRRLGVPRESIFVTGQMKHDNIVHDPAVVAGWRQRYREELGFAPSDLVLLCGSTHRGEEALLFRLARSLGAGVPGLRLVVVPRHLERVREVEGAAREAGVPTVRRTGAPAPAGAAVIGDTMGELERLYAAADLVFVGGSLVPHGGQNMIEPAALGLPVVFGPHVQNFQESARLLLRHGAAVAVADEAELLEAARGLLQDGTRRLELGRRARDAVLSMAGATRKNLEILDRALSRVRSLQ
jgi:3-deoxy-D-manno-octulosonic-acid transferase